MVRSLRIGHRRFVLASGVNTIGREPASTVCINDASVSRGHARITIEGDEATLEDLNSKNGTTVMSEAVTGPTRLKDGDEVEFGHVKGWFIVEASEDPPTTTGSRS
jgi:pSer/pThr/pTyr-binding forkhead associated (FHA) protein